ncbi:MAG: antibiotic biosynthesis monooxygenase [Actinobacteria bacterium]|nr:antibiotic biosynthesis monooxygenase [Actinomycetota bacterium]
MPFVNAGTLGTEPGRREELVGILVRRNDALRELGCQLYEVGTNETPDTVFVVEVWRDADAHRASLEHPDVRAAIAEARPLLNGEYGGFRFDVAGSPLRD